MHAGLAVCLYALTLFTFVARERARHNSQRHSRGPFAVPATYVLIYLFPSSPFELTCVCCHRGGGAVALLCGGMCAHLLSFSVYLFSHTAQNKLPFEKLWHPDGHLNICSVLHPNRSCAPHAVWFFITYVPHSTVLVISLSNSIVHYFFIYI